MASPLTLRQCVNYRWIRHFANTVFGIVLGFGGQAMLWKFLTLWTVLEGGREIVEAIQFFWWSTCVATYVIFGMMFISKVVLYPEVFKAEVKHPVRFNFFCGPIIALCMLTIAMPPAFGDQLSVSRTMWTTAFFCQGAASLVIYHRWLVSSNVHDTASSPYLLSLISWFLLSAAGTLADIDSAAGLPMREICFGVGSFFAVFTYPFILAGIYGGRTQAGTPASFLIIAPPSVAGISVIGINNGYHSAAGSLFGCVFFLFLLLLRMGPKILAPPRLLGVNWAYIFPQAAMSILAIKIAEHFKSTSMVTVAIVLSTCATLAILIVIIRFAVHTWHVLTGKDAWQDPLAVALAKNANADVPQRTPSLFKTKSFCNPDDVLHSSSDKDVWRRTTSTGTNVSSASNGNGTHDTMANAAASASADEGAALESGQYVIDDSNDSDTVTSI